jgi:hypothetical protein
MIRTYIDAGVLIAAARGEATIALKALDILDDPNRDFASSIFVKLEVLPKAVHNKNAAESEFYETFFAGVTIWSESFDSLCKRPSMKRVIRAWALWMPFT